METRILKDPSGATIVHSVAGGHKQVTMDVYCPSWQDALAHMRAEATSLDWFPLGPIVCHGLSQRARFVVRADQADWWQTYFSKLGALEGELSHG